VDDQAQPPEEVANIISRTLFQTIRAALYLPRRGTGLPLSWSATPHDVSHSGLLRYMSAAAKKMARTGSLQPTLADEEHLREWLEAADYAAQALVMMAGLVGLDAGVIPPPEGKSIREGGFQSRWIGHGYVLLLCCVPASMPVPSPLHRLWWA
jgi:hypothetical protein